ncbi:hypothetical protein C8Q80DRAFT_1121258 [Daedaleopsis nitida]|nr:hypothetical protein C8Q80DRAFT_1121258 [Daedaleopsis nitida]
MYDHPERYKDGTPILYNRDKEGHNLKPQIRRWMLTVGTEWATGLESFKALPWDTFHDSSQDFFAPGMLPGGVLIGDIEHMHNNSLKRCHTTPPRFFHLSSYRVGQGKNTRLLPAKHTFPSPPVTKKAPSKPAPTAIYSPRNEDGHPAPVPWKKSKSKKAHVPGSVSGPEDGTNTVTSSEPPLTRARVLTTDWTCIRLRRTSRRLEKAACWAALEKHVREDENNNDRLDSSLTGLDSTIAVDNDDNLPSPIEKEHSCPSCDTQHEVNIGLLYLPPKTVRNNGKKCYNFRLELSGHKEYTDMLGRVCSLTGCAPVKWVTWSQDCAHLPDPQSIKEAMFWLRTGVQHREGPTVIQRYCLVMGMVIHDITEVQMLEPEAPLPSHLPGYFTQSSLPFEAVADLLALSSTAFPPPPAARPMLQSGRQLFQA